MSGRIVLTERDRRLIELLSRFRLMSRDQLMTLAPFGSLTRANTRLATLTQARLLSRKIMPFYPGNGSAQALYFLGRASGSLLSIAAESLTQQLRQISRWDLRQVEHVITANQILADALKVAEKSPVTVSGFRTEPELRHLFSDRRLVPDGWFAWAESGRRFNCFVEVDLHHEGLREWRAKVLRYVEYAESSLHEERFAFRGFRVCVLAKSPSRLNNLRHIAEVARGLFLFSEIGAMHSGNFLDAIWLGARGTSKIRLAEA